MQLQHKEEFKKLRLYEIGIEAALQTRVDMSPSKVVDYEKAYINQATLPPLLVAAQCSNDGDVRYKLLDGWHRYQALSNIHDSHYKVDVKTLEVSYGESVHYLRYLGGRENLRNGLGMNNKDKRALFKAYVSGGVNKDGRRYKSYREIAQDLSLVTHQTLHNWMKKDFPSVARRMSKELGEESSQATSSGTGRVLTQMPDLSSREEDIALSNLLLKAQNNDSKGRSLIVDKVEALLKELKSLPEIVITKEITIEDDDMF